MTNVVILGGGFAGLYAALEFERQMRKRRDLKVTIVNRDNFILFTPMLHEVAASDIDLTHIVNPIRKMIRRVEFLQAGVTEIDLRRKRVTIEHGSDGHQHQIPYDHLILALGSTTNFFGLPGLEQHALTMKTLGDAMHARNLLIQRLEEADTDCACGIRDRLLTVVVAGGGFSGVETVAGINDFLRDSTEFYSHLSEKNIRVVLVHPGPVILPELGEELGAYAQKKLTERDVEIRVNTRVLSYDGHLVELSDGTLLESDTLIWTAGTSPSPMLAELPCMKSRGRVLTNSCMQVEGWPGVWALGDCAMIPDPDKEGMFFPPTAQHAIREGRAVAGNVIAEIYGQRLRPFRFRTIGLLAAIGKRTGVASILGFRFSGFIAWFLWRTIYLMKLPRLEKKIRVALDWTLDLFFSKDLVQFETARAATSSPERQQEVRPERLGAPAELAGQSMRRRT